MRAKIKNSVFLFCTSIVFISCGGQMKAMTNYFGTWDLISAYDTNFEGLNATLEFRGEERVFGNSGCNNYSGTYGLNEENRTLSFGPLRSTKMGCEEAKSNCQRLFFRALNNTANYLPKKEGIYLLSSDRKILAFIKKR